MGIRVDAEVMHRQLEQQGHLDWESNYFHKRLLAGDFPLTVGGGIGQSRICIT